MRTIEAQLNELVTEYERAVNKEEPRFLPFHSQKASMERTIAEILKEIDEFRRGNDVIEMLEAEILRRSSNLDLTKALPAIDLDASSLVLASEPAAADTRAVCRRSRN